MIWLLLIPVLALFIYISYRRPLYGLASIIVLLPSYLWRVSLLGLPTTFLELMILSLFVVWLIKDKRYTKINFSLSRKSDNKVPVALRWLLLIWLGVSLIGLAVNPTLAAVGLWRAYFLEPLMFFIIFIYTVNTKEDIKVIFKSLAWLVTWLFIIALYQLLSGWNLPTAYDWPNIKRLTVVFSYPNAVALLTAPLTTLFAGLWLGAKSKKAGIYYLLPAIFGFTLALLARSDGAVIAILVSLFFWLILAKRVRKTGQILVVLIAIVMFFALPVGQKFSSVTQQLFNPELNLQASSLEIRSSQWQGTWAMLQDNFFLGAGLNGYQQSFAPYRHTNWIEVYLYPHNIFLNFWSELSFFGLLAFLALAVYIIIRLIGLFKQSSNLAWPLTLVWLTWFIHGLVDVPYFKNDLSILFFVFLALTILANQKSNLQKV